MSAQKPESSKRQRRFDRLILLSLSLVLIFFLILNVYDSRRLDEFERGQDRSLRQRLDLVVQLTERALRESVPPRLDSIRDQAGILRISLVDAQGKGLGDSSGQVPVGRRDLRFGITATDFAVLLGGSPLRISSFRDESGRLLKAFYAPVQTASGTAIVRLLYEDPRPNGGAAPIRTLLWVYGIVASAVWVYTALRMTRRGAGPAGAAGDAWLMIDAFHGLIAGLKQKEEELQRLRDSAEERAETIENYNENVLQSVTSGVITFDRDLQITTLNAAAESILRVGRSEAIGAPGEKVFGAQSPVLHLVRHAVSEGTVRSRQELEMEFPGGERIWVGISVSLLRDRMEQIIGTTLVFTDLTEIKRLQDQVEAQKRLTMLGEMSAWIAHEFRNYMGTILGLARLLSKGVNAENPQQALIQSIIEELVAMDRLINELLSYGRRTEIHLEPASLGALVSEVIESFQASGKWDRIRVDIRIPSALPPVALDLTLMRQALSNLFQNAIEALEGSEGPAGARIRVAAWARASEVVLEICDNGEGIPQDHLDKIFLPFFTTKEKGTGLGLALVHKIVLSHNGRIEARNQEKGGACFTLTLPLNGSREIWKQFSSSKIAKA